MELRAKTQDEIRQDFYDVCASIIDEWSRDPRRPVNEAVEGAIFSVLSALDGSMLQLPPFKIVTFPQPGDADFCKRNGENWIPEGVDIGHLHGGFHEGLKKARGQ